MKFIVVTNEWMSAHGLIPLPTMRKSKGGSKIILHEDYFNLIAKRDEEGNLILDGAEVYAHNSEELKTLLNSEELTWSEEAPTESSDFIQVAAVRNLMTATKAGIQTMNLSNSEIYKVVDVLPAWEEYIGKEMAKETKFRYNGKPYVCIQTVNPVLEIYPPSDGTKANYGLISEHDGTLADPIPYERNMVLEKGKYYTQFDVLYECITDSIVGYDADLTELLSLLEIVE